MANNPYDLNQDNTTLSPEVDNENKEITSEENTQHEEQDFFDEQESTNETQNKEISEQPKEEIKEENIVIEDEKYFFCFYIRFCRIKLFKDEMSTPIKLTKSASTYLKTESFSDIGLVAIWDSISVFPDEKDFFDIGDENYE